MGGLYGKVLPEVFVCAIKTYKAILFRTDRANEVNNKGFIIWLCCIAICRDFVEKTKNAFAAKRSAVFIWVICLFRIVKLAGGMIFVVIIRHNSHTARQAFLARL